MEKKTLMAVVLSAAVFIVYYGFIYKPPVTPRPQTVAQGPASTANPTLAPGANPTTPTTAQNGTPKGPEPVAKVPIVLNSLETPLVKAELSSQSGFPQHWWLKKFFISPENKGPHIDILQGIDGAPPMGLLLFPGMAPLYPDFKVQESSDQGVTYFSQVGNVNITQKLDFPKEDYTLHITLTVENSGKNPQVVTPGLHLETIQTPPSKKGFLIFKEAPNFRAPLYMIGTKVKRHNDVNKLGTLSEEVGDISWAGIADQYFLRAIIAREVSPENKVAYGKKGNGVFTDFLYRQDTLAAGQKKEYQFTVYLGPKNPTYLKAFESVHLDKAIDYGWFSVVALPILYTLKFFQSFLKNWGLAIIALTLLIKLLLHPLTKKSMESMKSMQTLQPQLQKLREKYKDDRERLNLETMSLFKANKVNPMGGCLPMVIQMPIYIALYKVLYNATELYHAPFFGPYHDLSASDPYYILPILLGVFMVLQQKMTPTTGDPQQAKMMMFMPIIFTAFMLFLPVGLVLYIFVNTAMTVVQQWMHREDISFFSLFKGKKAA